MRQPSTLCIWNRMESSLSFLDGPDRPAALMAAATNVRGFRALCRAKTDAISRRALSHNRRHSGNLNYCQPINMLSEFNWREYTYTWICEWHNRIAPTAGQRRLPSIGGTGCCFRLLGPYLCTSMPNREAGQVTLPSLLTSSDLLKTSY